MGRKKKGGVVDDDEYSIGTELSEESTVVDEKGPVAGKKKGKGKKSGGGSVFSASSFGLLGNEDEDNDDSQSGGIKDEGSDGEDELMVSLAGKKKSSKKGGKSGGNLFTASAFEAIDDEDEGGEVVNNDVRGEDDDVPVVSFTGKKKASKGGKKGGGAIKLTGFDLLDEADDGMEKEEGEEEKDEVEDEVAIAFAGKKKKKLSKSSGKSGNLFSAALLDEENNEDAAVSDMEKAAEEDVLEISFSGKKKPSKKKSSTITSAFTALDDKSGARGEATEAKQLEQPSEVNRAKEAAETSKNKKKKNKSGRTVQEEEDLDKILAELGVAPPVDKPGPPPSQKEKVQDQPAPVAQSAVEEKAAEEEPVESAAAKKKKKKKEKEKEKKAAAAAAAETENEKPEEIKAKGKAADKKLPKHVREMQEALARRKEAEERKKREEEEKLRKEEEERRKQEELERQAEEARRRKKEKEKEKLLKKKLEGKLLTGKQKEEARRLEAMRKQILENAGVPLPADDKEAPAGKKRPIYKTKKIKPTHHLVNGADQSKEIENVEAKESHQDGVAEAVPLETDEVDDEAMILEEKLQSSNSVEQNNKQEDEDGDDGDWETKSWDDVNISVPSSFADEEVDTEQEVKVKEAKNAVSIAAPPASAKPTAETATEEAIPVKSKEDKNKKKDSVVKKAPEKNEEDLRSPICCIMGHVDTGKTKLLDCIRRTNVQEGEAGGITQQIGATYFPAENIRERTRELKADAKLKVPGLLVIDTPGHESFTNLRSRGSGLCDIAILVVDIMHGLEQQTDESLNLLKMRNTEFIVALNKVDRLYGWKTIRNAPIVKAMKQQNKDVQIEFNMRLTQIITQFKERGVNTELYYKNKEMGETSSIVPTSAISGEGIPDLLLLLVQWTQKTMVEKLTFLNEVQCTVLEVKVIEGHGTTIDVVLVNGVLHEGDQIVVCGLHGPIVTTIRALLTPHPMKELRVKGTYLHHKEIKAAQGIKITAQGLEHAIAGTALYVVGPNDDLEDIKEAAMEDMKSVMSRIDKSGEGVCVQASTLGSLEALLEYLKEPEVNIPVSGINIGPVHKKDVMKASVMLEKKKEYAAILAFDVKVTPDARELADDVGVKIFCADIIYHLFDQFKAYINNIKEEKKREAANEAVFPSVLKILPNCVFNKKDPIVLGVDILEGILKIGTPICIPQRDFIDIGRIASIENNHKPVDFAKKGQKVAIKIIGSNSEEQQKMYGRHFDIDDELVSHISRSSIDVLKANYRDELSTEEWKLVVKLKTLFKIQ